MGNIAPKLQIQYPSPNNQMLRILSNYNKGFSIINKIRRREKLKNPPVLRAKTKPYQIGDVIGTVTSYTERINELTPFQQYLIQTNSMQRPYTGNLWGQISAGFYHCAVCDTRLFSFDQKFQNQLGYACFYDCVEKRVTILEDKTQFELVNIFKDPIIEEHVSKNRRCQCSQCKSHIGAVMFDGPFPTFLRFAINSHLLVFKQLPQFEDPNIKRRQKVKMKQGTRVRYI